jgi:DegV family protein with EDD domain
MSFRIFTDSSCDLSEEQAKGFDVTVVPLYVTVNKLTYKNGELPVEDFYAALRRGEPVSTSAPNVQDYVDLMSPVLENGEDILVLSFSSALSASFQNAEAAARLLRETRPERKIVVIDTLCASLGQGLLVAFTAEKRLQGASLEECAEFALKNREKTIHWFTVADLKQLRRGGRVSAVSAIFGTALNIKPVLHVDERGKLIPMERVRGRKASLDRIAQIAAADGIKGQRMFLSHGDCIQDAEYLKGLVMQAGAKSVDIGYVGPVIGAHSGVGTIALFYMADKR